MSKEINTYAGKVFDASEITFTPDEVNKAVNKAKLYPTPVNADKGKYLKYDESGNIIFDDVPSSELPLITITAQQVTSVDPIIVTLTSEQKVIFESDDPINIVFDIEGYFNSSGTALRNFEIMGRYIFLGSSAVSVSLVAGNNYEINLLKYVTPYNSSAAGQIPVTDGNGGYFWQTPSSGGNNGYTVSFENLSGQTVGVLALCSLTENGIVGLQNFEINNNETTTVYKCQYIFRFGCNTARTTSSTFILAKDAQSIVKGISYADLMGSDGIETLSALDVSTVSQSIVFFSGSNHSLLVPESNSNLKFVYSQD